MRGIGRCRRARGIPCRSVHPPRGKDLRRTGLGLGWRGGDQSSSRSTRSWTCAGMIAQCKASRCGPETRVRVSSPIFSCGEGHGWWDDHPCEKAKPSLGPLLYSDPIHILDTATFDIVRSLGHTRTRLYDSTLLGLSLTASIGLAQLAHLTRSTLCIVLSGREVPALTLRPLQAFHLPKVGVRRDGL